MAWTQADIDKLKAAIAGGAVLQSMTFGDQSFTFRTMDAMLQVLALMQQEVNATSGTPKGYRLAATSKGA
jgi:hypothetical protein